MAFCNRSSAALLVLCATPAFAQQPKIVQPGAPGEAGKILTEAPRPPAKGYVDADVAFMQGITGAVASWAQSQGWPIYRSVNLAIAVLLLMGALAFQRLPRSASMVAERSA